METDHWMLNQERDVKITEVRREMATWTPSWWARPLMASAMVLIGFTLLGLAIAADMWWFAGVDTVETSVTCEDDFVYEDDEDTTVEGFTDPNGTPCWRVTADATDGISEHWPAAVALPLSLLVIVVTFIVGVGGIAFFVFMAVYLCGAAGLESFRDYMIEAKIAEVYAEYEKAKAGNETEE